MKFCANISMLYTDMPLDQRIGAARANGFEAVEILFPYDHNAADLAGILAQADLPLALINAPPPNYTGGARGFAALPEARERFRRDLTRVLRYAGLLRPQHIHIMAGPAQGDAARDCFIDNLRHACATAPDQSFTIEPLNPVDMPGYFLADFDQAARIIEAVGAPNLGLQYDAYHAQMITGDAVQVWADHGARARHVQIGDAPGRGAPGTGDIDFAALFDHMRADGYTGWISAEYTPGAPTDQTLEWMGR